MYRTGALPTSGFQFRVSQFRVSQFRVFRLRVSEFRVSQTGGTGLEVDGTGVMPLNIQVENCLGVVI